MCFSPFLFSVLMKLAALTVLYLHPHSLGRRITNSLVASFLLSAVWAHHDQESCPAKEEKKAFVSKFPPGLFLNTTGPTLYDYRPFFKSRQALGDCQFPTETSIFQAKLSFYWPCKEEHHFERVSVSQKVDVKDDIYRA